MRKQKQAFTLVELIVVITILTILGTIAFISLKGYSASSRDSVRISDVSTTKIALELFHLDAGRYPLPDDKEEISYETDTLWYQGTLGKNVISQLSRSLQEIPTDPLTDQEYIYSTSWNKNNFQILSLLETDDLVLNTTLNQTSAAASERIPRVDGEYNGLFLKTENFIFPTPSLITSEPIVQGDGLEINATNIQSQVISGGNNIPDVGNINSGTGKLNIKLSVFTGDVTTKQNKIDAINRIISAYSGSDLEGIGSYREIISTTGDDNLVTMADIIILNNGTLSSSSTSLYSCNDLSKPNNTSGKINYTNNATIDNQDYAQGSNECGYTCTDGYSGDVCDTPPSSCGEQPIIENGSYVEGTPTSVNQTWIFDSNGTASCSWKCDGEFVKGIGNTCVEGGTIITWVGSSGDWNATGNWDLGRVPEVGDSVIINKAATITLNTTGGKEIWALDLGNSLATILQVSGLGELRVNSDINIGGTSKIIHASNTTTKANIVNIVASNLSIDSGGSISGGGLGSSRANGAGAGVTKYSSTTRRRGGGGAYGGNGGAGYGVGGGTGGYGNILEPIDLGSGGGDTSYGGSGGGAVKLIVSGTLILDGSIASNGSGGGGGCSYPTYFRAGGGGSGGSIWIDANTIEGNGSIQSNGGNGYFNPTYAYCRGGAGGGGRIALYYNTSSLTINNITTNPGTVGHQGGSVGTVYMKDKNNSYGGLYVKGTATSVNGVQTKVSSPIGNRDTLDLHVSGGGNVKLIGDGYFRNVNIATIGIINSNGLGNTRTNGVGAGISKYSSTTRRRGGGGAYGGNGGAGPSAGGGIGGYGNISEPTDLGSGGGDALHGGSGGGAIKLILSGDLTLDGSITANGTGGGGKCTTGTYSSFEAGGGGSGGSIWIDVNNIEGNGSIQSNGGNGYLSSTYSYCKGGAGGGGRIALSYNTNSLSINNITTNPGTVGNQGGGIGTIYMKDKNNDYGGLYVKGTMTSVNGVQTKVSSPIGNRDILDLHVSGGGNIKMEGDGYFRNVDIATIGMINSNGLGNTRTNGVGAGLSKLSSTTRRRGGGGAYGGNGGAGPSVGGGIGGYGNISEPIDLGSGGGDALHGGSGGGAIKLILSGDLTLDGRITTNGTGGGGKCTTGTYSSFEAGGGGSGGSIWIDVNNIEGNGSIQSNGGNGYLSSTYSYCKGGAGGGGRVALYYNSDTTFDLDNNITVNGGTVGYQAGSVGTKHIEQK